MLTRIVSWLNLWLVIIGALRGKALRLPPALNKHQIKNRFFGSLLKCFEDGLAIPTPKLPYPENVNPYGAVERRVRGRVFSSALPVL